MIESQFQEWYKDELMPSDDELNSLEHYGVKGQKWGVRRTPEQLGHITEKKRRVSNWIQKAHGSSSEKKTTKKQNASPDVVERNKKIKRVLLVTAGVSVAAIGAYAISKKYSGEFLDKTLKSGTKLRTITNDYATSVFSKKDLETAAKDMRALGLKEPKSFLDERQRFYASYKDPDVRKYFINLGGQLLNKRSGAGYLVTTSASKDLKVASLKNAKKVFSSLYTADSSFRAAVDSNLFSFMQSKGISDKQFNAFRYGMRDLSRGKITDRAYKAFNASLVQRDGSFSSSAEKFYESMRSSGYSAIEDLNDKLLNEYRTRSPLIVFDKNAVDVRASQAFTKATKLTMKELLSDDKNASYLRGLGMLKNWFDD